MHVCFDFEAGFAEVNMAVNHAGQQGAAFSVDDLIGLLIGQAGRNFFDSAVFNKYVSRAGFSLVYENGVGYESCLHAEHPRKTKSPMQV